MFRFFDLLFPPRADELLLRETSLDTFLAVMKPMLVPDTRPASVMLFSFGNPLVRAAIHEAKYHGSARAFRYLGIALADYLYDQDDTIRLRKSNIVVVPVPLGRKRLRERGFNQVEEIVRSALHDLHGSMLDTTLLERVRETHTQVSLPREKREQNMRSAFRTRKKLDSAATYILIDDVLTTGATLQAAIDALKAAGATNITPLALAH